MAAVVDTLVPYLQRMVKGMAVEELRDLLGVTDGIKKLEDSTEYFKSYMADAERRCIDDATMKGWVRKLKDALYEAIDVLELYQLHAEERRQQQRLGNESWWRIIEEKAPGFLEPLLFCLRNPGFAHGLGVRLKQLNASFDDIRTQMVELKLNPLRDYPLVPSSLPGEASTPRSRKTTPSLRRSSTFVVGIEWDTRTLVHELLADDEPAAAIIKVVSLVGAGGMGKTTLAKNIFNHGDIQAGFAVKIWLSVTDSYDVETLLSSANAQGLRPSRTGNLLLVMDDMWPKKHPWAAFLPIINNGAAARVIITTRDEGLLRGITTRDIATLQRHVNALQPQDAWSLLKQQVMCSPDVDTEDVDRLQHIGKEICLKCGGSPLAIKVIAGLLTKKEKKVTSERYWKSILEKQLSAAHRTREHEVNSVLRLSYDDLSPAHKQCFLYFSLFPKGLVIQSNHIVGMWISEGFLGNAGPGDTRTRTQIEEDGLEYYEDLVQASLIEPAPEIAGDGSVCKMHDVIRSFAHEIAEEELLAVGPGQNSQLDSSTSAIRQLSVESTELESSSMALPKWSRILGKHRLRSLIINGRVEFDAPTATEEHALSNFPSLRALFVRHAETERFVESLCSLRHLRFLHLDSTDITRLPDGIGGLRFLQHIGLDNCRKFSGEFPRSFLELQRLTSLKVDGTECTVPKGFGDLTGLRRLSLFPTQTDGEWCSLQELGQLQELVRLEIRGLAAVPSATLADKARIHDKEEEQLDVLVLMCYNPPESISISEGMRAECQRIEEVFDHLRPSRLLDCLVLKDYMGRRLPSWMCVGGNIDLDSLTSLEMVSLPFCTQLPDGLCWLASLKRLYIKYAWSIQRVGPEFQRNNRGRRSFPKLEFLRFDKLPEWEEWEWEEEAEANRDIVAMPRLQQLGFFNCNLRRLPAGLASSNRRALRELVLWDLPCITSLENFPSVKELNVARCPRLRIIRGLANLRGVSIELCPALEVLQDVPALDTMQWTDPTVNELPNFLGGLRLNILHLYCNPELTRALGSGNYRTTLDRHPICNQIRVTPVELVVVSGGSSSTSTV